MKKKNEPYTCPVDVFPATSENTHYVGYTLEEKPGVLLGMKVVNKSPNDLPTKATEGSAAMDVRAWCHNENFMADGADWDEESKCIRIFSGGRAAIPTGLYFEVPKGYELQIRPRSGLAIKSGIEAHFGTLDADFRGEMKVILFNFSNEPFEVRTGDRIAQILVHAIADIPLQEVDELEQTERGDGGFGHSGIK